MKRALNVIGSLCVLGVLFWWADAQAVIAQLRGVCTGWVAAAVAALTGVTALMAKRWQMLARSFDIEIDYRRALGEYYLSQMVNFVLPGGVAGDVTRAVRLRQNTTLVRAAQSVMADRILGQGVMFVLLGGALTVALLWPGGLNWPKAAWAGIGFGALAVVILGFVARGDHGTGRFLLEVGRLFGQMRLCILSLVIAGLLIFSFYACARAAGTDIPPAGWLTVIPLVLSAMLIPLSVGGWGWREGAAAALFPLIGAPVAAGIATGIVYGAAMMLAALPGLYFAWRVAPVPSPAHQH
ncbi:lysylphosphatidylglycerol synthase transmembrane domain-containing protein [Sulfitobacter sp.]|uniref:lysylphosphatidylglycerol synthase transmembrane domain-containing protein n=1 Tax=Sulfitobacter sp. TaxID=1903071 RepID=UPI003296F437